VGQHNSRPVSAAHVCGDLLVSAAADPAAGALQPDAAVRRRHVVHVHARRRLLLAVHQHRHRRTA